MFQYGLNFFVWWYLVQAQDMFKRALSWAIFVLEYTNTLEMAKNLFIPMFQDKSGVGKVLSFFIRAIWVWIGGMITVVLTVPIFIGLIIYVLLPILTLGFTLLGMVNILK